MAWTGRRSLGAVLSSRTARGGYAPRRRGANGGGLPGLPDSPRRAPHSVAHMAGWSDYALWAQPESPVQETDADLPAVLLVDAQPEPGSPPVPGSTVPEDLVPDAAAADVAPAPLPEVVEGPEVSSEDMISDVGAFDELEPPWDEEPQAPPACDATDDAQPAGDQQVNLELVLDVTIPVRVKIAEVPMTADELLRLGVGAIIELRKPVSQPVDLCVRETSFARGEVVVVDNNFGLRVTQIGPPMSRLEDLGEADEAV